MPAGNTFCILPVAILYNDSGYMKVFGRPVSSDHHDSLITINIYMICILLECNRKADEAIVEITPPSTYLHQLQSASLDLLLTVLVWWQSQRSLRLTWVVVMVKCRVSWKTKLLIVEFLMHMNMIWICVMSCVPILMLVYLILTVIQATVVWEIKTFSVNFLRNFVVDLAEI